MPGGRDAERGETPARLRHLDALKPNRRARSAHYGNETHGNRPRRGDDPAPPGGWTEEMRSKNLP